uniref:Leucine-rich repeat-containing N-terminal plant-type domain-containing protein n=2 Tax=Quercus lobata TaxID=97700 RepID=A0A7N2MM00_QUELO
MRFLFFLWGLSLISVGSFSTVRPLCHDDESFALLQFKQTFTINQPPSYAPANSKISSWLTHNSDCCMWDGVQCDENTGYVTSLDLSSSYLYGSINSSSSLFQLVHLQWLNLANNNFNHSRVPLGVRQLSKLTYLNLSNSAFSGQIPSEILQLSKLVSLDIGLNSLSLHKHGLKSITDKLMNLEELVLSEVEILSTIPSNLANLSSLTSIDLSDCRLHGEFPIGIFQLPNLKSLNVSFNSNLTGHVPEFNRSSPLEVLGLAFTSFSGMLPDSIGNLKSLFSLDVGGCNFSGPIPSTFDNLTELTYLRLSSNNFNLGTLSWVGKHTKLTHLYLKSTNLFGFISFSLRNLTQLKTVHLGYNHLTGPIPSWLANLTQLNILWLQANNLYGPIPMSISNLKNLQILDLFLNQLSGTVKFDLFLELKSLFYLQLSGNDLSLHINPNTNTTLQKFKVLGLGSCHLNDFPDFLRNQDQLEVLLLDNNTIHGQITKWIANVSKDSLVILDLSANFLTGFDQTLGTLPWTGLKKLDLFDNKFQVSLPIPPPSIISYDISNNSLHGEISQMICNLSSLSYLDLSYNNLSGFLPQCLRNLRNLSVFNLQHNNFHGRIPQIFLEGCKLRMISLNHNGFQGPLPSSLANCTMLEILDLGNNHIIDFFPSWLDILPELRILILQSNGFHGILTPNANFGFPKLHVIDLSNNNFSGKLPSEYFQIWKSMKSFDAGGLTYMKANGQVQISINGWFFILYYPMTFTIKGIRTEYEKIQNIFVAIDLSSNRFEGEIPKIVGNLRVLHTLNLSKNILTGSIPLSLVNLTNLESLDLSQNMLSGEIPMQLVDLTFLAVLNVSHNHLTGPIPEGKQFSTFENSSFDGNEGLCGSPLSKKCAGSKDLTPPPSIFVEDQGSESPFEFDWKPVMMGYGCGFIVGVFVGKIMIKRKYDWFRKTFAVGHPT